MSISAFSDYGTEDGPSGRGGAPLRTRWSRRVAIDIVAGFDVLSLLLGSVFGTLLHRGAYGFAGSHLIAALELCLISAVVGHFVLRTFGQYDEVRIPKVAISVNSNRLMATLGMRASSYCPKVRSTKWPTTAEIRHNSSAAMRWLPAKP